MCTWVPCNFQPCKPPIFRLRLNISPAPLSLHVGYTGTLASYQLFSSSRHMCIILSFCYSIYARSSLYVSKQHFIALSTTETVPFLTTLPVSVSPVHELIAFRRASNNSSDPLFVKVIVPLLMLQAVIHGFIVISYCFRCHL